MAWSCAISAYVNVAINPIIEAKRAKKNFLLGSAFKARKIIAKVMRPARKVLSHQFI